ncbi:MAG: hypothetical protein K0R65_558 [Crocinitomicaceae bacterium]|jgi:hypothetical protein|nr:hypothetical protein [Crocinitomicaceae bacterium]
MKQKTNTQITLIAFMTILILSGVTAFPIDSEMNWLYMNRSFFPDNISDWIFSIWRDIQNTPDTLFYGTDWLAFAHIIISLFFIPVYRNPVKHQVNLHIGMIACLAVFPLAFICGPIRGIPFAHQLIDCSFGVIGFAVLFFINNQINRLKHESTNA